MKKILLTAVSAMLFGAVWAQTAVLPQDVAKPTTTTLVSVDKSNEMKQQLTQKSPFAHTKLVKNAFVQKKVNAADVKVLPAGKTKAALKNKFDNKLQLKDAKLLSPVVKGNAVKHVTKNPSLDRKFAGKIASATPYRTGGVDVAKKLNLLRSRKADIKFASAKPAVTFNAPKKADDNGGLEGFTTAYKYDASGVEYTSDTESQNVNWTSRIGVYENGDRKLNLMLDVLPNPFVGQVETVPAIADVNGSNVTVPAQTVLYLTDGSGTEYYLILFSLLTEDGSINMTLGSDGKLSTISGETLVYGLFSQEEFDPTFATFLETYVYIENVKYSLPGQSGQDDDDSGIAGFATTYKYKGKGTPYNGSPETWTALLGKYTYGGKQYDAFIDPIPQFSASFGPVLAVGKLSNSSLILPAQPIAGVTAEDGTPYYLWLFNPNSDDFGFVMSVDSEGKITTTNQTIVYGYFTSDEEIELGDGYLGYEEWYDGVSYTINNGGGSHDEGIDPGFENFKAFYKYEGSGTDYSDKSQAKWNAYLGEYSYNGETFDCIADIIPNLFTSSFDCIPLAAQIQGNQVIVPAQPFAQTQDGFALAFSAMTEDGSIVLSLDDEGNLTTTDGEVILYGAFTSQNFNVDNFLGYYERIDGVKFKHGTGGSGDDDDPDDDPGEGKWTIKENYEGSGMDASSSEGVNWIMTDAVYTQGSDNILCLFNVIPNPYPDDLDNIAVEYSMSGDTIIIKPQPVFSSSQWTAIIFDGGSDDAVIRLVKNPNGTITGSEGILYGAFRGNEFDPTYESYLGYIEYINNPKYRVEGSHMAPKAIFEPGNLGLFLSYSPTFYSYTNIMQLLPANAEVTMKNFTYDLADSYSWNIDELEYDENSNEYRKAGEQVGTDKDFTFKTESGQYYSPVTLVAYDGPEASEPYQHGIGNDPDQYDTEYLIAGFDASQYVMGDGTSAQVTKANQDNGVVYMTPLATHQYNSSITDAVIKDLVVYQGKPAGPLYTEGVTFWVGEPYLYYDDYADTAYVDAENERLDAEWVSGALIKDDFRLVCEIRKASRDDSGALSLGEVIATSVAKKKDFVTYSNGTGMITFDNFFVYDTDGLTISKDHLFIDEEFAIVFKDWSTSNTFDCIPISERNASVNSLTSNFFSLSGEGYDETDLFRFSSIYNNLYVGFKNACYGYLDTDDLTRITIGSQGGKASITVHPMEVEKNEVGASATALYLADDCILPSWVKYGFENEDYTDAENYSFDLTFDVEPLPADMQSRTCTLNFWQKGARLTVKVEQSAGQNIPDADGIDEVISTSAASAPAFNVAGQKVDAAFKGIVVSKGRKFVAK